MSQLPFVAWAAIVSLSIAFSLISFYLIAALYMRRFRRKGDLAVASGTRLAIHALSGKETQPELVDSLRKSPASVRLQIFHRLSAIVSGEQSRALEDLAERIGIMRVMERQATSRFWWRRLQAVRFLSSVDSHRELIKPLLQDSNKWVTAEAISWAGSHPGPELADDLLRILDEGDLFLSSIAQEAFARYGEEVSPKVASRINDDAPARNLTTFLTIAAYMRLPAPGIAALRLSGDHPVEVRVKIARLLGATGVNGARDALTLMLRDAAPEVRIASCAALAKLSHQQAAADIAGLLADDDWEVRNAAAEALSELGPIGKIMLQSAVNKESSGWEIARQRLDQIAVMEPAA